MQVGRFELGTDLKISSNNKGQLKPEIRRVSTSMSLRVCSGPAQVDPFGARVRAAAAQLSD